MRKIKKKAVKRKLSKADKQFNSMLYQITQLNRNLERVTHRIELAHLRQAWLIDTIETGFRKIEIQLERNALLGS